MFVMISLARAMPVPAVYVVPPPEPVGAGIVIRFPMTKYEKPLKAISPTCDAVKVFPSKIISGAMAVLDMVLTPFVSDTPIPSPAATTSPLAPTGAVMLKVVLALDVEVVNPFS